VIMLLYGFIGVLAFSVVLIYIYCHGGEKTILSLFIAFQKKTLPYRGNDR
jgi:hypothetical protein